MRLFCTVSGLSYSANAGFGSHAQVNPALSTTLHQLESLQTSFWNQLKTEGGDNLEFTPNRYLYLLAWLLQLPKVTVREACNPETDYPVLLANSERLVATVRLTTRYKQVTYPAIAVSSDARIADCLPNWLDAINATIAEYIADANTSGHARHLHELTEAVESVRSLDSARVAAKNAKLVAAWASAAAGFPRSVDTLWQSIIVASMQEDKDTILSARVTKADIAELLEHCEDYIPHGSYHAHALMAAIRQANGLIQSVAEQASQYKLEIDYTIPEPKRTQYSSQADYLRARLAWQRARTTVTTPETQKQSSLPSSGELADLLGI